MSPRPANQASFQRVGSAPAGRPPSRGRRSRALLLALLLPALAVLLLGRALPARAAGVVGGSCTNHDLVTAMAGGGLVTFNCGLLAHTIVITQTGGLLISADTTLDGGGRIILSGGHAERIFTVSAGRTLTLTHITLANGTQPGSQAGAINNQGTTVLDHVIIRDSAAGGPTRFAGAIYNDSTARLIVRQSQFLRNASSQGGAIFNVLGGVVDISGTQFISNSVLGPEGGAIYNNGQLTLTNSTLDSNVVSRTTTPGISYQGGGGLTNDSNGRVILVSTVFTGNQVQGPAFYDAGGGLLNRGVLTVTGGVFSYNRAASGGGLLLAGQAVIISVTAIGNTGDTGGGLHTAGPGPILVQGLLALGNHATSGGGLNARSLGMRVLNSQFMNNDALSGGAMDTLSAMVISNSTFSGNQAVQGGAIYKGNGTLQLYASTLAGNSASQQGGGLFNDKNMLVVENVTVSGNSAADSGGGLYNGDEASLRNVTLSGNGALHGGALFEYTQAVLTLTNSILANSPSGGNCGGQTLTASSYSLSSDNLCGLAGAGDHNLSDPKLSALGNFGGPTQTHLPAADSPAVDGVVGPLGPPTDQRGVNRPVGVGIDIGAVERLPGDTTLILKLFLALTRRD